MVFVDDIEKLTLENTDYRRVIFTTDKSQLVLMSIPAKEDIEMEVHDVDQFFRIEQGYGELQIGKKQIGKNQKYPIKDKTAMVIPAGTFHRVVNVGNIPLKLYSIYTPPEHPRGRVDKTKNSTLSNSELLFSNNSKPKENMNLMKLFYLF